jgi:hypothetical protein
MYFTTVHISGQVLEDARHLAASPTNGARYQVGEIESTRDELL